jgi:hypothetical protein
MKGFLLMGLSNSYAGAAAAAAAAAARKLQREEADRAFKETTPFHRKIDLQRSETITH